MARSRLAAALVIPGSAGVQIDGLRQALGSAAIVRIAPHITLVPPVNVADDRLPEAVALLERGAAAVRPLRLTIGPPATFFPPKPVLYLAVGGDDSVGVEQLHLQLCVEPLERRETRRFVPHVTINEHADPRHIDPALELLASFRLDVTIDAVQLLQYGEDRRWRTIADAALGGPRVIGRGGLEVTVATSEVLDPEAATFFDRTWEAYLLASDGSVAPRRPFAVAARREGVVVGVATGWTDDELLLDRLVTDAAARGQGVGSHLLAEVMDLAAQRGCHRAVLVCRAGGPAEAFYVARGWTVDMALPAWRHGRDFVRMARGVA
jgi:2'-5' RNA ligase